MKRYHIIFKGIVQGVGFRYISKTIADRLDLTGTVKNLANGDVEMYIQGEENRIERFLDELNNQRFINIESMDKNELEIEEYSSYKIVG